VVMLIWDLKESEPSRMTPRLFIMYKLSSSAPYEL